jgi:pyrroline-5-carboxylate reductase
VLYTGCGTMGIAVLSGVVESLDSSSRLQRHFRAAKWESHTPGTSTPVDTPDASSPARFIACVSREESAKKLRAIFSGLGPLGASIEIVVGQNVRSAEQADVVLLWCVVPRLPFEFESENHNSVASLSSRILSWASRA